MGSREDVNIFRDRQEQQMWGKFYSYTKDEPCYTIVHIMIKLHLLSYKKYLIAQLCCCDFNEKVS